MSPKRSRPPTSPSLLSRLYSLSLYSLSVLSLPACVASTAAPQVRPPASPTTAPPDPPAAGASATAAGVVTGMLAAAAGMVPADTADQENIVLARQKGQQRLFSFEPFTKEAFARARQQGKLILLDGAAEWCHWCHVMDETTYADPEVGRLLRDRFVALRIDVDERPDIAARYEDWGWPATILFSSDAEEIGKFRGYLAPERMREILQQALDKSAPGKSAAAGPPADPAAPADAMRWVALRTALDLDRYWDAEQGGWGGPKKAPLGANIEFELRRRAHGDQAAGERALLTLRKVHALVDPVWGGVYQYSTGGVWDHPHFEKLMPVQAAAIAAYARGYQAFGDPAFLLDARLIAIYLDRFLSGPEGAFWVSQDADVGAHDKTARFVDGHVYYALDGAGRRALGLPRTDPHVYPSENGLAIAALCALYEATRDGAVLARAGQAADVLLKTHVDADGSVRREAGGPPGQVRQLLDAAAFGYALSRLYEVGHEDRYRDAAQRIAQKMLKSFAGPGDGLLYITTPDPAAAGVFARRAQPFAPNVSAARFLLALSRAAGDTALHTKAMQLLRLAATPRNIDGEGRMLGEFLLTLDEAGVPMW